MHSSSPWRKRIIWLLVSVVVLTLFAALALPNFVSPPRRSISSINACIANLKQIEATIEQYAMENHLTATNHVSITDISGGSNKFIRSLINVDFVCPQGGIYSISTVGEPPRCSVHLHSQVAH